MLISKYKPNNISEFIGNTNVIYSFSNWLLNWNTHKEKGAIISGPSGIGKSLLIELTLKHYNYEYLNINNENDVTDMINNFSKRISFTITKENKKMAIIINDIDTTIISITDLQNIIKKTLIPIICSCNNPYDISIKPIKSLCILFKMITPTYEEVYHLLYKIISNEKIKIKQSDLKRLYEMSNGDIRFILNNLSFATTATNTNTDSTALINDSYSHNTKEKSINNNNTNFKNSTAIAPKDSSNTNLIETTNYLFSKDNSFEDKYNVFWNSPYIHPIIIHENYITNIRNTSTKKNDLIKLQNISHSADSLSDLNIIDNYIHTTNDWEFLPYIACSTIKTTTPCNNYSINLTTGKVKGSSLKFSDMNGERIEKKIKRENVSESAKNFEVKAPKVKKNRNVDLNEKENPKPKRQYKKKNNK